METQIPDIYKEIRVESMYWDDMKKRFPKDQFREEDVEYEKNAENVDSMYIVITKPTQINTRRMVYWRWGPEAKFYHHLQALYQVIEGGEEMLKPYQKQLGRLWEKCKNAETKFQGIGRKRYPNDEREDKKYLKERYKKAKSAILKNPTNNDLEELLIHQSFLDICDPDVNTPIYKKIIKILYEANQQITSKNIQELMINSQKNQNGVEIKVLTDMLLVIFDINNFQINKILPIDYIVAFILKSYEKRDILTNQKNSFRIFGLKTDETIWLNERTKTYMLVSDFFKAFIRNNMEYLSGKRNTIENEEYFYYMIPNEGEEKESLIRNYFENNFRDQINELTTLIDSIPNENVVKIYFQGKNILDLIISLPKRERKLVASILQKKKDEIIQAKAFYFQGEKLYISFYNLPIFIYLFYHKEDENIVQRVKEEFGNRITQQRNATGIRF